MYTLQLALEVSVVRRRLVLVVGVLVLVSLTSVVALSASPARFKLGEDIQFRATDSTAWFWGCCTCTETLILGWRIVNSMEQVIYSVRHDVPVPSSSWLGTWSQVDSESAAAPEGVYKLHVDTSVGMLSRCFVLYDPCSCCWCGPCPSCTCEDVFSITNCACRVTLAFTDACQTGCLSFPLFWGWGCCGCP